MSFQSANSNALVTQEEVVKKEDVPVNMIPVFDSDRKMKSSGVDVTNLNPEASIVNALIFG